MDNLRKHYKLGSTPHFQEPPPKMLEQLRRGGFEFDESEASIERQLWDFALSIGLERRAGSKITTARFQSGIAGALKNLPFWGMDTFVRTLL